MQIQHPLVQQYQSRLISSKDNEIEALRERVNFLQTESFERGNLQDIIAKVIALTKENSELKAAFAVKELEMTNLYQQYQRINTQIEEQKSNFKRRLQEKGQIQKRVRQQLEQANQKLLSESQGYIKYQSAKFELESLKEYSERELSGRDQLIRELKAALKLKNELNIQTSSAVEIEIHKNSNLHQEINRLKNLLNKQDYEKTSVLEIKRQEIQQLKTQVQNLQEINRNLERDQIKLVNANSALKQENEHLKEQNQNQTRMPMKNKEEPSSKVQICKQCNRLHIQISRIQLERSNILEQLHILKAENDALQQQEERRKRALEYSQKIPILNAEFNRLEQVIQNLKQKNNQLLISNHEFEIELQKQQHNKQKLVALNQEILRLQAQNIDLVEEVNVYRLEFSQEANQEQQLQQSYSLLALRSRVQLKEKELQQLNKKYLRL